jgi:hypothetical protein
MAKNRERTGFCLTIARMLRGLLIFVVLIGIVLPRFLGSTLFDHFFMYTGKFFAQFLPEQVEDISLLPAYDYNDIQLSWVAHPNKPDFADHVPPDSLLKDEQQSARIGVFFVHPTGYFGNRWNARPHPNIWSDPIGVVGDFFADLTGMSGEIIVCLCVRCTNGNCIISITLKVESRMQAYIIM